MILKTDHLRFWKDESGVAAVELALILPVLVALLLGVVDSGNALLLSKKAMTASNIVADLITRNRTVTQAQIDDSLAAARMALAPYSTATLGVDIASIQYTGAGNTPSILWRQTDNMTANPDVLTIADGLGVAGEGVVIVTTEYDFTPVFLHGMFGNFTMQEVSITRGRRGPIVSKTN